MVFTISYGDAEANVKWKCGLLATLLSPLASSPPFGSQVCLCVGSSVCLSLIGGVGRLLKLGRGDWLVFGRFLNISRVVMVARSLKLPNLQLGGSYFRLPTLEKAMTSRLGGPTYWSQPAAGVVGVGCGGSGRVSPVVPPPLPWFRPAGRKRLSFFFFFSSLTTIEWSEKPSTFNSSRTRVFLSQKCIFFSLLKIALY